MEIDRRGWVSDMYPGKGWKNKVHKMSDGQVTAIYLREINKPDKPKPLKKAQTEQKLDVKVDDIPF